MLRILLRGLNRECCGAQCTGSHARQRHESHGKGQSRGPHNQKIIHLVVNAAFPYIAGSQLFPMKWYKFYRIDERITCRIRSLTRSILSRRRAYPSSRLLGVNRETIVPRLRLADIDICEVQTYCAVEGIKWTVMKVDLGKPDSHRSRVTTGTYSDVDVFGRGHSHL